MLSGIQPEPWTSQPGILIVEEAGGRCSDMKDGPADVHGSHLLADNGGIFTTRSFEAFRTYFPRAVRTLTAATPWLNRRDLPLTFQ